MDADVGRGRSALNEDISCPGGLDRSKTPAIAIKPNSGVLRTSRNRDVSIHGLKDCGSVSCR
jgi:hypothetical protein